MAHEAQTIAVFNEGAFVMSFGLQMFDPDALEWQTADWDSGAFPIGSDHHEDLSAFGEVFKGRFGNPHTGIPEGASVRPEIRVRAGSTVHVPFITYKQNGQTATWVAHGTTYNVDVKSIGF